MRSGPVPSTTRSTSFTGDISGEQARPVKVTVDIASALIVTQPSVVSRVIPLPPFKPRITRSGPVPSTTRSTSLTPVGLQANVVKVTALPGSVFVIFTQPLSTSRRMPSPPFKFLIIRSGPVPSTTRLTSFAGDISGLQANPVNVVVPPDPAEARS